MILFIQYYIIIFVRVVDGHDDDDGGTNECKIIIYPRENWTCCGGSARLLVHRHRPANRTAAAFAAVRDCPLFRHWSVWRARSEPPRRRRRRSIQRVPTNPLGDWKPGETTDSPSYRSAVIQKGIIVGKLFIFRYTFSPQNRIYSEYSLSKTYPKTSHGHQLLFFIFKNFLSWTIEMCLAQTVFFYRFVARTIFNITNVYFKQMDEYWNTMHIDTCHFNRVTKLKQFIIPNKILRTLIQIVFLDLIVFSVITDNINKLFNILV